MLQRHPLADAAETDSDDLELVRRIQNGDREALESLVRHHQDWIYNIALRMVYLPEDAEDATQEILIKLLTKLSTFEGRSSFRTWLYRLVCNHVLNLKRGRADKAEWTFSKYRRELESTPDLELPDPRSVPADVQLLVDEARIGCTSGMLLCLDREQRLIYILGDIFDVSDSIGAELLEISRDNFRQKLSRARRDLHSFMHEQCGLVKVSYRKRSDGSEHPIVQWNATETYARLDGQWRIVHSHWSYVQPELKQSLDETSEENS